MWVNLASNCIVLNFKFYDIQVQRTPHKLTPGWAWKPGYVGQTHAGSSLPYTNFNGGRRPDNYIKAMRIYTMFKKRKRIEADKERRSVTLGGAETVISILLRILRQTIAKFRFLRPKSGKTMGPPAHDAAVHNYLIAIHRTGAKR